MDVKGRHGAVVDGLTSTGITTAKAPKIFPRPRGEVGPGGGGAHGVFAEDALHRLRIRDEVAATDTVQSPVSKVSASLYR